MATHTGVYRAHQLDTLLLWPQKTVLVVGCMFLMGLQIELCQYFIPMRYADIPDLVADAIGCAFDLAAVFVVRWVKPVDENTLKQVLFSIREAGGSQSAAPYSASPRPPAGVTKVPSARKAL